MKNAEFIKRNFQLVQNKMVLYLQNLKHIQILIQLQFLLNYLEEAGMDQSIWLNFFIQLEDHQIKKDQKLFIRISKFVKDNLGFIVADDFKGILNAKNILVFIIFQTTQQQVRPYIIE